MRKGLRWVQAEHRVRPELLVAQTGYMQGAAGIGMWLLRLDAAEHKPRHFRALPRHALLISWNPISRSDSSGS